MKHKFDPKNKEKLESKERQKFLPAKKTLQKLMLKEDDTVLDIGCGIGYFTIPAAKIVNKKCKVFAVDTSAEMLAELKNRLSEESIDNVQLIKGDEYNVELENESIDYILISNVIHEVDDKDLFLDNYLRKLKPGGKIAIIDFKKIESEKGPPIKFRVSKEEVGDLLQNHNLKVKKKISLNSYQYGIIGTKKLS